ncbi:glycerophosphoryl diester phosphodiesterase [Halomonas sp. ISL-60]|uniref:glycerophosphodiester phosphodiesterase family protein n=1 Tax=Halomonas sp. ISL-56 TaxID=2819149 RepID=UPI001BEB0F9C|nr:glycerophosphodiester phosphodiesterase family protein [Halomonas sp. ISL-56]MBT2773597.1 glycerophosphoryl diester phosphodiesterase [Halomonas sp. ISL-60]MBT2802118.1 glycerophosphoryl diester phosphodiesterase [Halomonas sp. ISL-56]
MTHPAIQVPALIAHRGYSAAAPENTLAAVRAAHQAGATWVELDVQLLGDGTPVIWHDSDVARCSNGRGSLASMNWAKAQTLDAGSWFDDRFSGEKMPSLAQMLALLNELEMGVNMEIKVNKGRDPIALVERALPEMLDTLPPERLIISSFNASALSHCRQFASTEQLALGVLFGSVPKNWREQCEAIEAFSVHPHWPRLKRAQADAMQRDGYQIMCYTANDPSAFHSRWAWGIGSVITDEPAAFKRFLDSH